MAKNRKTAVAPSMNVTPLVDVVLVLLIIFMVITPLLAKNFWVHLPPQAKEEVQEQEAANDDSFEPVVLSLAKDGSLKLNGNDLKEEQLTEKLKRVFAARTDYVMFFDASDEAEYGTALRVMDKARAGGAVSIAILTKRPDGAED